MNILEHTGSGNNIGGNQTGDICYADDGNSMLGYKSIPVEN